MRNKFTFFVVGIVAVLLALPAFAQVPTGTITGTANYEGAALPGVTVTVTSDNLMQPRRAVTQENGDYIFRLLPPGTYVVAFELAEFQTLETTVLLPAAQTRTVDAQMSTESLSETLEVTASLSSISSSMQADSTMNQDMLEKLPVARTVTSAVALQPGVHATGPSGNITISGSQSYENLFMVNGVVVNENLRGQPFNMFIEDAVQETTTAISGVSAEYGRFAGGVVNTLTKSGGNDFSGSLRANFDNDEWTDRAPIDNDPEDKINNTFEATLGGFLWKDKIWFFIAGRDRETDQVASTTFTNIAVPQSDSERRIEGKLTLSPHPNHRIVGSYFEIERDQKNRFSFGAADTRTTSDRSLPLEGSALNYTGVITDNFFVEAQWSERTFAFAGGGGDVLFNPADPINTFAGGTWTYELALGTVFANAPVFCGVCPDEERNNENYLAKASYFLSTDSMGSHEIVGGYDTFDDIRKADNHQSSSGFAVINLGPAGSILADGDYSPVFLPNATWIWWAPILESSKGTSFKTDSLYVNDTWRFNEKLTFNIGVRHDANDGSNSVGQLITEDSKTSPRLGMSWDPKGDGDWIVNASYGEYVGAIANSVADGSSLGGNPAYFNWVYRGDTISGLNSRDAMTQIGEWFFANVGDPTGCQQSDGFACDPISGSGSQYLTFAEIPGATSAIERDLSSPAAEEFTVGVTKRLGSRGVARVDYVHRDYNDFYASFVDTTTGTDPDGITDFAITRNEDSQLKRAYDGVHTNIQYRLNDKLSIGANYTWSQAIGNFDGETSGSGPVTSDMFEYPEYKEASWNNPVGFLSIDQRHKARAWFVYDVFSSNHHNLSFSALQSYNSGSPYGATAGIDSSPYVNNPGYLSPPDDVTYFFTSPHAFRTDDFTRTDVSLNYSFFMNAFGRDIEMFFQPELLNMFNETNVTGVNTSVLTASDDGSLAPFDPFTETPVEGVHWRKGDNFGVATGAGSFQTPRTYRFSIGFRF